MDYVRNLWSEKIGSRKDLNHFLCLPHTRVTYLFHFQHESGRIGFKIVVHADPGENLIGNAERGIVSRYAGAWENNTKTCKKRGEKKNHTWLHAVVHREVNWLTYLSHDLTQRHLFEVGGLAAHVGPSDDDKVAARRDVAVVSHILVPDHSLQNGVTTVLDGQGVCKLWPHLWAQQRCQTRDTFKWCNTQSSGVPKYLGPDSCKKNVWMKAFHVKMEKDFRQRFAPFLRAGYAAERFCLVKHSTTSARLCNRVIWAQAGCKRKGQALSTCQWRYTFRQLRVGTRLLRGWPHCCCCCWLLLYRAWKEEHS